MKCPKCGHQIARQDLSAEFAASGRDRLVIVEALCPACSYTGTVLVPVGDFDWEDE